MGYSNDQKFTHTLPPVSIYEVLHKFECLGGDLPMDVEMWWEIETVKNEEVSNTVGKKKEIKRRP